jgi:type IV pilus assembly protein PilB
MDQATAQAGTNSSSATDGSRTILDILLIKGHIDKIRFDEVKLESVTTGQSFETILANKGLVQEETLIEAKAELLNVPYLKLSEVGVSPEALGLLPESVAKRYRIMPFAIDKINRVLSVAMTNPMDLTAIEFVEKKSGMRIVPYMASETELTMAIQERYSQNLSSEVVEALKDVSLPQKRVVDVTELGQVIREAPIAKIVETILSFAIKSRASDIHIEPLGNRTRIRYRIDGILHEKLVLPREVHEAVISRIKILAEMKIDEKRVPQDGRFNFKIGNEEVDLRISSLPTQYGEKIVMRLLKKSLKVPTMNELGLRGMALRHMEESILVPHGIILITGPTGSGKTTTLYGILNKVSQPKVNVVTLEDPVEYEIPGVNQVQVNPQAGLTFSSGLRAFLRQDPNVIMVGEIRDQETAELAIQASLTGHLVFSTLHTSSAAGALPRLMDMGAKPFLLASSITLVMAQRVARNICPDCKTEYTPVPEVVEDMKRVLGPLFDAWLKQSGKQLNQLVLYKGAGCQTCGDTGYFGRQGIFEVLKVTDKISRLIVEGKSAQDIEKQAVADGMILMKQDGYLKALEGITTIEEVLRVAEI